MKSKSKLVFFFIIFTFLQLLEMSQNSVKILNIKTKIIKQKTLFFGSLVHFYTEKNSYLLVVAETARSKMHQRGMKQPFLRFFSECFDKLSRS